MAAAVFTERQTQIIEQALQLIAERGIEKLTYRNLASSLGVTEPAFYRHFASKSEILMGILVYFEGVRQRLFDEIRAVGAGSLEGLEAVVTRHLELFQARPALTTLLFPEEVRQGREELQAKVREMMRFGNREIAALVRQGLQRGEIRPELDPEQVALVVSGALRLLVTQWRLEGYGGDLRARGVRLWETLASMLRPGASADRLRRPNPEPTA